MKTAIFKMGAGTAAIVVLAVLGMASPTTAQAGVCNGTALPDFGISGPGALQGVLDSHTIPGPSSVNVATDCLPDGSDAVWQIGGSGGSINTIMIELAGFAASNTFGIWDAANPANTVQLFDGAAAAGDQTLLSILADGSVRVNFADTGIDFAGNAFGYYLHSPQGMFYSDTTLNTADNLDHMYAYQGKGDTIQIPPFAPGPWGSNEYVLAWEDLLGPCATASAGGADCDYTDFVVLVESVTPVPEPASLALLGAGLFGLGAAKRRRMRAVTR